MDHLIGQRFNLISKSDIRYVGTLHEINPEQSTIALENVVSHGTEGRRNGEGEIAPSSSVYEYIVFRGSDVKDISVAEDSKENKPPEPPQVPDDPAILGSGTRPPQSRPQNQDNQQQQRSHQPPPGYPPQPPFPYYGYPPPPGQDFGPPGRFPPGPGFQGPPPHFNGPHGGPPPGWFPPPGHGFPQGLGQFPPNQMQMGPQGPQHHGQPNQPPPVKPTSELPVNDKVPSGPTSKTTTPVSTAPAKTGPTPPLDSKPSVAEALAPVGSTNAPMTTPPTGTSITQPAAKAPPTGPRSGRVAIPMPATTKAQAQATAPVSNGPLQATVGNVSQAPTAPAQPPNPSSMQDATRAATAAVAAAMAKLPPQTVQRRAQQADTTVENLTRKVNEMRTNDATRGPRGGFRGDRGGRGAYRGGRAFEQQPTRKVEVPTTDYDFESANAKFNKQDLVKEAIASGSPINETPDGGNPSPSIDSINGAAAEANAAITITTSYNKASSFFDNISSESKDREQNTSARPGGREWRGEEEKKNMETFGQGSVDGGFRGGYRGRGRGRGFQRGRGGFRGPSRGPGSRGGFRGGRGDAAVGAD